MGGRSAVSTAEKSGLSFDTRTKRNWHTMALGEQRVVSGLTIYQVQSQVYWVRKRRAECKDWRWKTRTVDSGDVVVERIE